MKDFVLIFKNTVNPDAKPSPEQMQQIMTDWMNWMASIAAQNKLADKGNRLSMSESKTVGPGGVVTDGPFTEIKEFISGYIIVRTSTIAEATELAKGCPVLRMGGKVDVRAVVTPDDNS